MQGNNVLAHGITGRRPEEPASRSRLQKYTMYQVVQRLNNSNASAMVEGVVVNKLPRKWLTIMKEYTGQIESEIWQMPAQQDLVRVWALIKQSGVLSVLT